MPSYYVAKTPNGEFVGQFKFEEIPALVKSGRIRREDFATEAAGSYEEMVKSGTAKWTTVAALLVGIIPVPVSGNAESSDPRSQPLGGLQLVGGTIGVVCVFFITFAFTLFALFMNPATGIIVWVALLAAAIWLTVNGRSDLAIGIFLGLGALLLLIGKCYGLFLIGQ